jgi:hypothetical protein
MVSKSVAICVALFAFCLGASDTTKNAGDIAADLKLLRISSRPDEQQALVEALDLDWVRKRPKMNL